MHRLHTFYKIITDCIVVWANWLKCERGSRQESCNTNPTRNEQNFAKRLFQNFARVRWAKILIKLVSDRVGFRKLLLTFIGFNGVRYNEWNVEWVDNNLITMGRLVYCNSIVSDWNWVCNCRFITNFWLIHSTFLYIYD